MKESGVIISGSFALSIIHPGQFTPNDIDFYVTSFGFATVLLFVQSVGYTIIPSKDSGRKYGTNLIVVELKHSLSQKCINIITGLEGHAVRFITRFHSTLVMNYISWFGLVSLYPEWTLNKAGLIVTNTKANLKNFQKYKNRGYKLYNDLDSLGNHSDLYCPQRDHHLNDDRYLLQTFGPREHEYLLKYENPLCWNLEILCPCCVTDDDIMWN
jgi:hypothetical protein